MATEVRQIIFTDAEVTQALVNFSRFRARILPAGYTNRVAFHESDKGEVLAELIIYGDDDTKNSVMFEPVEVVSALIYFCQDQKIPMARRAHKTTSLIKNRLVLTVTIGVEH